MSSPDLLDALQDSYPPVNEADIRKVEREIGLQFPDDYVAFLLRYNGGCFQHTVEFVLGQRLGNYTTGIEIRDVSSITDDADDIDDVRSLTHISPSFDEAKPRNFITIAGTWSQDQICLAGSGPEFGEVFLWDGEEGKPYRIARTFAEFMGRLKLLQDGKWLIADPDADTIPVFRSIRRGDADGVREFLQGGGDVSLHTASGLTLLMCAANARWPKIVAALLARDADVHARDSEGRDAIWHAVRAQSEDCTKLLLAAGADPSSRDKHGKPLLDIFIGDRLRKLLVEHGAKPTKAEGRK